MKFFKNLYAMMVLGICLHGFLMPSSAQGGEGQSLRPVSDWAKTIVARLALGCEQKKIVFEEDVAGQVVALVEAASVAAKIDKKKNYASLEISVFHLYANIEEAMSQYAKHGAKVCSIDEYRKSFAQFIAEVPDDIVKNLVSPKGNFIGRVREENIGLFKEEICNKAQARFVDPLVQAMSVSSESDKNLATTLVAVARARRTNDITLAPCAMSQPVTSQPQEALQQGETVALPQEKHCPNQEIKTMIQEDCKKRNLPFSEKLFEELGYSMGLLVSHDASDTAMEKAHIYDWYQKVQQSILDFTEKQGIATLPTGYCEYEGQFLNALKQVNYGLLALIFQGKNIKKGMDQANTVLGDLTMRVMHKVLTAEKQSQQSVQSEQEAHGMQQASSQPARDVLSESDVSSGNQSALDIVNNELGKLDLNKEKIKLLIDRLCAIKRQAIQRDQYQVCDVFEMVARTMGKVCESSNKVDEKRFPIYFCAAVEALTANVFNNCLMSFFNDVNKLGLESSLEKSFIGSVADKLSKGTLIRVTSDGFELDQSEADQFVNSFKCEVNKFLASHRVEEKKEQDALLAQKELAAAHGRAELILTPKQLVLARQTKPEFFKEEKDPVAAREQARFLDEYVKKISETGVKKNVSGRVAQTQVTNTAKQPAKKDGFNNVVAAVSHAVQAVAGNNVSNNCKKDDSQVSLLTKRQRVALLQRSQKEIFDAKQDSTEHDSTEQNSTEQNSTEQDSIVASVGESVVNMVGESVATFSPKGKRKQKSVLPNSLGKLYQCQNEGPVDQSSNDASLVSSAVDGSLQQVFSTIQVAATLAVGPTEAVSKNHQAAAQVAVESTNQVGNLGQALEPLCPPAQSNIGQRQVVSLVDFSDSCFSQVPSSSEARRYQYNPYSSGKPFQVKWLDKVSNEDK